jgi:hypothetical protein
MKTVRWAGPLVTGVMVCLGLPAAEGAMITYSFGGQITSVTDAHQLLQGSIREGDAWSGTYTIDSETPDYYSNKSTVGLYFSDAPSFVIIMNAVTIIPNHSSIYIVDRADWDGLSMGPYGASQSTGLPPGVDIGVEWGLGFTDPTGTANQGDALPLTPLPLELYSDRSILVNGGTDLGFFRVDGTFDWFSVVVIPEPGAMALGICAITVLLAHRRARSSRKLILP